MNNNKSTVVEQYHTQFIDNQIRPEMIEVFIAVNWYAIDDQPNWVPTLHARKSRVVNKGVYDDEPHNVYETTGMVEKLDKLFSNYVWKNYCGQPMPKMSVNMGSTCRPDNIFQQPIELIEALKRYKDDVRMKAFVCGTGKFYVESHNKYKDKDEKVQVDPNPNLEEISKMVMLFETEQEAKEFIKDVMKDIKGFTSEQIKLNETQYKLV